MDEINKKALEDLKRYRSEGCHMLIPCMAQIQDVAHGFRLVITPLSLRPHPKDKDVYPHEGTHYNPWKNEWEDEIEVGQNKRKIKIVADNELVRIAGQGLEKAAQNANIVWSAPIVKIDPNNPGRQLVEITGAVRMPDGFSFYRVPDCYGMDLEIEREKLAAQYSKKKDEDRKYFVDRDLLQKKANQTKLCISGAKNRVIRKLLGIDNTYTVASLAKPFIAVRVIPWLDMNDEYTRRLVIGSQVKQMMIANIFGGASPEQQEQPAIEYKEEIPVDKCKGDVIEGETVPEGNGATRYHLDPKAPLPDDDEPPFASSSGGPSPESLRADFQACDTDGQCKALRVLAGEAGRNLDAELKVTNKTLEGCTPAYRLKLYDYLTGWGKGVAA